MKILIALFCAIVSNSAIAQIDSLNEESHCSGRVVFIKKGEQILQKHIYINDTSFLLFKYEGSKIIESVFKISPSTNGVIRKYDSCSNISEIYYSNFCKFSLYGTDSYTDFYKQIGKMKGLRMTYNLHTGLIKQIGYFLNEDNLIVINFDDSGLIIE